MKKTFSVIMASLILCSANIFALEIECENETGTVLKVKGNNSTARDLSSGELVNGELTGAYHITIDVLGVISNNGAEAPVKDTLVMMRRGRVIYTNEEGGVSLYWNSPNENYQGQVGDHIGEFSCSLSDF
jgi:hypothetical protein